MAALKPKHPELLRPGQSLVYNTPNDRITSASGQYSAIVEEKQFCIRDNTKSRRLPLWQYDAPDIEPVTTLVLSYNDLRLNRTARIAYGMVYPWSTPTFKYMIMQDDGNLVIYGTSTNMASKESDIQAFWASNTKEPDHYAIDPTVNFKRLSALVVSGSAKNSGPSAAVVSEYSFAAAASAEDASTRSLIDSAAAGGAGDGGRAERMRAKFAEMGLAAENAGTPAAAAAAPPYTPPPKGPIVLSANPNIEIAKNTNTTVSQANMLSLRLDLLKGTNEYSWAILTIQELFKYDPALLKRILLKVVDNDKGSLYIFRMFAKIPSTENPFIALAPIPAEKQRLARVPYAIDNLIKILNKNGTNTKAQHISLLLYAALTEKEILNTFGDEPGRGGSRNSKKKTLTRNMRNYKNRRSIRR